MYIAQKENKMLLLKIYKIVPLRLKLPFMDI